ncbi:unnamed protein product [Paramecium octaurelia]|uniref:Uncharacterized protein n=1 Tax=Paramecium octaurelia TaxID=43137 RepID=A0A8S1TFD6_PAROT|nr:unnamed protein product [Paramecium octaurelia]
MPFLDIRDKDIFNIELQQLNNNVVYKDKKISQFCLFRSNESNRIDLQQRNCKILFITKLNQDKCILSISLNKFSYCNLLTQFRLKEQNQHNLMGQSVFLKMFLFLIMDEQKRRKTRL